MPQHPRARHQLDTRRRDAEKRGITPRPIEIQSSLLPPQLQKKPASPAPLGATVWRAHQKNFTVLQKAVRLGENFVRYPG
jgi:hypothetical protein